MQVAILPDDCVEFGGEISFGDSLIEAQLGQPHDTPEVRVVACLRGQVARHVGRRSGVEAAPAALGALHDQFGGHPVERGVKKLRIVAGARELLGICVPQLHVRNRLGFRVRPLRHRLEHRHALPGRAAQAFPLDRRLQRRQPFEHVERGDYFSAGRVRCGVSLLDRLVAMRGRGLCILRLARRLAAGRPRCMASKCALRVFRHFPGLPGTQVAELLDELERRGAVVCGESRGCTT